VKRLFEYAVILQEKTDKDGEVVEDAQVLVEPTSILAEDLQAVNIIAARAIPEEQVKSLDRILISVRPF
jgi:hypothetical protein